MPLSRRDDCTGVTRPAPNECQCGDEAPAVGRSESPPPERLIRVDTTLPVHAQKPLPLAEVVSAIERQVRNAQAFCRRAAETQFFQPGCPVQYNRPLPPESQ